MGHIPPLARQMPSQFPHRALTKSRATCLSKAGSLVLGADHCESRQHRIKLPKRSYSFQSIYLVERKLRGKRHEKIYRKCLELHFRSRTEPASAYFRVRRTPHGFPNAGMDVGLVIFTSHRKLHVFGCQLDRACRADRCSGNYCCDLHRSSEAPADVWCLGASIIAILAMVWSSATALASDFPSRHLHYRSVDSVVDDETVGKCNATVS